MGEDLGGEHEEEVGGDLSDVKAVVALADEHL